MKLDPKELTRAPLALGLVHWPVLDRAGSIVCTNVTNFDVHDIARVSRSYGVEKYYIINRMQEQLMFVSRMLDHWQAGYGSKFNPMRKTALGMIEPAETVEQALGAWRQEKPLVVATSAKSVAGVERVGFKQLRSEIHELPERPVFLLFGTGFGLDASVYEHCDRVLEPISGAAPDSYNHLSVRSAVSICLDRLLGTW